MSKKVPIKPPKIDIKNTTQKVWLVMIPNFCNLCIKSFTNKSIDVFLSYIESADEFQTKEVQLFLKG